jgi:hypothetical protein
MTAVSMLRCVSPLAALTRCEVINRSRSEAVPISV